jgi:hypothetical protein
MFLDRPTKIFAAEKIILMLLEKYCMFLFTIFEKEKIYYLSTYPLLILLVGKQQTNYLFKYGLAY